ncbi:MAG: type II toxin-antitoxin system VapC family toxin [Spirochaetes bacterium]|nr:MAG: type II toxin-antitoxin system VapC family toxin [Spirochaetota bacterium]
MILPDVNILIHAINTESPLNKHISGWWDNCLSGSTPIYLPWVVILGFVRISTNRRIFDAPLSLEEASGYINSWLSQPPVSTISPGEGHWPLVEKLLKEAGTAGNLTTDAHIAALAIQWDCKVYSTDTDFARFSGVKWKQP